MQSRKHSTSPPEVLHVQKWLQPSVEGVSDVWTLAYLRQEHSPITQGPDPKPICTGTTIHSQSITHGDLASYKVHVRVFGRATDDGQGLNKTNDNTVTIHKWVNLLSLMLDSFKNNGHCATMDSAYIGNIMAMIGRDVWHINMVGTAQAICTSANVDCTKLMKKETYGAIC